MHQKVPVRQAYNTPLLHCWLDNHQSRVDVMDRSNNAGQGSTACIPLRQQAPDTSATWPRSCCPSLTHGGSGHDQSILHACGIECNVGYWVMGRHLIVEKSKHARLPRLGMQCSLYPLRCIWCMVHCKACLQRLPGAVRTCHV